MSSKRENTLIAIDRLLSIMDDLREKCPWDKKQTFESLRHLTIEETYELADAILDENDEEISKELGDLLLHIVFYAKIGSERKTFDLEKVANDISEKLIFRHPHIYGDVKAEDEETVKRNWEKLKLKEGRKSVFSGVPKSLPALVKAMRIQDKARGVGFDWDETQQVIAKVKEELNELEEAVASKNQADIEEEFGDLLFSLVNYSRFIDVNPETSLERTNKKFIKRFELMEDLIKKENLKIQTLSLDQMDVFWEMAKKEIKKAR